MNILTSPKFEELKTAREFPSSKGIVRHIISIAQKDDVTAEEIVRVIKADPALAARVVKAANSGALRGHRMIVSVPDAVVVLGLRASRQIALEFSLLSQCPSAVCRHFDYEAYWHHALATAVAFEVLAEHIPAAPPEEAFVAGLLIGIGRLALATIYPEEYGNVLLEHQANPNRALAVLERDAFATDHNELGAALLAEWGMPRAFVDAAYHAEQPQQSGSAPRSRGQLTAHALHFAACIGTWCLAPAQERAALERGFAKLAKDVGLARELIENVLSESDAGWSQWRRLFAPDVPERVLATDDAAAQSSENVSRAGRPALRLLVVDDDPAILGYLEKTLAAEGHHIYTASNGERALELAVQHAPHVIITDWMMPGMDGVTLCKALRQMAIGRGIYIVVLTDLQDAGRLIDAFDAGVDDYVRKPVSPKVLIARLRAAERVVELHEHLERDREQMRRFAADLAIENRRYQQAALTDPLTGFPNRRYALERLEQDWAAAQRSARAFACLLVDIDHFKEVNDTYGHDVGDRALKRVAHILRQTARAHDVICRLGGEEFLVICPDTSMRGAQACAERLRASVQGARIRVSTHQLRLTVSIGIAVWNRTYAGSHALVKAADMAMYAAKQAGRNRCSLAPAVGLRIQTKTRAAEPATLAAPEAAPHR